MPLPSGSFPTLNVVRLLLFVKKEDFSKSTIEYSLKNPELSAFVAVHLIVPLKTVPVRAPLASLSFDCTFSKTAPL